MAYRVIQVGCGGFGNVWCRKLLPPYQQEGRIEVVAAVDIQPDTLVNAREGLGLREEQTYTDMEKAFAENPADFCIIVIPPSAHERVVDLAVAHDMHILSEKPVADTLAGVVRVVDKVTRAGKKMGITFSHRFDQDKTTFWREVKSGDYGPLDYVAFRSITESRTFGSWGELRHTMDDPLLVEAAAHHFDIVADMAEANCDTVYAQSWNPAWGEFGGDSQALVIMNFENNVRCTYEGGRTTAVGLNSVSNEYVRAECRDATLIVSNRRVERFCYNPDVPGLSIPEGQGEEIPLLEQPKWSHAWLIEKFIDWLDGGEPMESRVERALQSAAINTAAVLSSRTGQPVKVQELLAKTRKEALEGR